MRKRKFENGYWKTVTMIKDKRERKKRRKITWKDGGKGRRENCTAREKEKKNCKIKK